jgi:long-chain acyl-CoA synthetase
MNAWWTTEELEYGLTDSGAKLLVADRQRLDRAKPLLSQMGLSVIAVDATQTADNIFDFGEVLGRCNEQAMPTVDVGPDDDATILYTSGSTGSPKGVVGTHRGIVSALMSWLLLGIAYQTAGLAPENNPAPEASAALLTVPLFHVTGCHSLFLLSIILGRKLVMMYKWDPVKALELIEQEKITYVNGVPTISQELLDAAETSDRDISSLVELFSGGAARPPEHVKRIKEGFKLNPGSGYGLTETNALGAVNAGETYIQSPDSVGIPSPAITQIRIVDDAGNVLASGERGEICIKSAANARCYWNKPEATAEAFKDGWFRTGDVGYLDENGMLFIVDRIKDIIIRGGENISCIEVESAIYAHDGVAEVAVFSLPDDRLGEIVAAMVYLKPGVSLDAEQLRAFLVDQLASYKIPAYLEFSQEHLPRTATDKILKRQIKEQVVAALS